MQPSKAGHEREPCGVAKVAETLRVHSSNCSSLLKQIRLVELPRGLRKAESNTPQERREAVKRQIPPVYLGLEITDLCCVCSL